MDTQVGSEKGLHKQLLTAIFGRTGFESEATVLDGALCDDANPWAVQWQKS